MATQIPFVDELTQIMESLKSHKRYSLRSAAIVSILVGSTLNFATLLAVFIGGYGDTAPKHLTAWTSIVLSISFTWNLADLASHSDRILKRKYLISVDLLVFVDTLGFLGFLALLIANGIIVTHMFRGPTMLMVYNSVPWMFCCAIHGLIALQICQACLSVWAMEARAVVSVTIRQRDTRHRRKMEDISLCLKEQMRKMDIKILKRMPRVTLSSLQSGQRTSHDWWTVGSGLSY